MKKIYIIALIAAMVSGLLLYGFLSGYEKKSEVKKEETNQKMEQVVVAVNDIPAYVEIKTDMVQLMNVPMGTCHKSAAHKLEDVVGKITDGKIVAEEMILTSKLLSHNDAGGSLSLQIPKGKRAMTIAVDVITGVAGYIEQNDLIDIMVEIKASPNDSIKVSGATKSIGGVVTKTIAESVKVLRVGEVSAQGLENNVYANLTLLLTAKQCQKIFTAEKTGSLKVILREKTDKQTENNSAMSISDVLK